MIYVIFECFADRHGIFTVSYEIVIQLCSIARGVNMEMKTFVFFDTETTGFRGCDPPKITEMAFVACLREHLLNPEQFDTPRVIFKLLLPLNPMKMIHPESTRITRNYSSIPFHNSMQCNACLVLIESL